MRDQIDLLAMVTVLGVLEQAYFALQVISARRKHKISPPETTGHPEFERIFRAQSHCTVRVSTGGPMLRAVSFLLCSYGESNAGAKLEAFTDPLGFQANCSEYFPIFISLLWVAGIFFHQGVTAACGLLYLYTRLKYFQGYAVAAQGRLGPLYASAWLLWLLLGLAMAGLLAHFLQPHSSTWMAAPAQPLQQHGAQ